MAANDIRVQKLGDQILRIIARRIINGELPPGSKAPSEQEICLEFGVSKTVAREVAAALVGKGLVIVRQGRRPEVRPSSEWNIFDPLLLELQDDVQVLHDAISHMQDVRAILEPEIAARAAASISDERLEELRAAHMRMRELAGRPERFEADVDFHVVLAHATENPILAQIIESLRNLLRVSVQRRAEYLASMDADKRDYHQEIVDAVSAHDADAAYEAMRAHMRAATKVWKALAPDAS